MIGVVFHRLPTVTQRLAVPLELIVGDGALVPRFGKPLGFTENLGCCRCSTVKFTAFVPTNCGLKQMLLVDRTVTVPESRQAVFG